MSPWIVIGVAGLRLVSWSIVDWRSVMKSG
jgi:hypothetical protein